MSRPTQQNSERGDARTRLLEASLDVIRTQSFTHGVTANWTPASLAAHIQAALQGAFILAKAADDRAIARESVDHLKRYIETLFALRRQAEVFQ